MEASRKQRQSLRHSIPSLHSLMLFEASARHLSFSKAAEELLITQPAVSHGVRQLEASLGQLLFLREHRALSLTSHGQRLFASVSDGLASISDTVDEIANVPRRDIVVVSASTVMTTEWLLPLFPRLRAQHPDLLIELRNIDRDPDLSASGIDIHIRLGDGSWPGYETVRLWPERIVAVCSPDYLARRGGVTDVADLLNHDLIHYVDALRYRLGWAEWLRASGLPVPLPLPLSIRANDSLFALKAAECGEGVVLGWTPLIDRALAAGRLVLAHPNTVETGRHFYAVSIYNPARKRYVAAFCEWLVEQANLPEHGEVGGHGDS